MVLARPVIMSRVILDDKLLKFFDICLEAPMHLLVHYHLALHFLYFMKRRAHLFLIESAQNFHFLHLLHQQHLLVKLILGRLQNLLFLLF